MKQVFWSADAGSPSCPLLVLALLSHAPHPAMMIRAIDLLASVHMSVKVTYFIIGPSVVRVGWADQK